MSSKQSAKNTRREPAPRAKKALAPRAKLPKSPQRPSRATSSLLPQSPAPPKTPQHQREGGSCEPDVGDVPNEGAHDPRSYNSDSPPESVPRELLPKLVQMANSEDDREVLQGVLLIRKLLDVARVAPIQEVVDTGVAPRLAQCMQHPNHELQFEASSALLSIACGNTANVPYLISLGVVPLWVSHLTSPSIKCVEQATWAVGNIAGEGAEHRDHVLEAGAMTPLLNIIQNTENCSDESLALMRSSVWALSNLCRHKPQPAIEHIAPAVPVLVRMVQHPDLEIILDSLWALSYICDGPEDRVQLVVNSGVVLTIVNLLDNTKFQMTAVSILGNICAGTEKQNKLPSTLAASHASPSSSIPRGLEVYVN